VGNVTDSVTFVGCPIGYVRRANSAAAKDKVRHRLLGPIGYQSLRTQTIFQHSTGSFMTSLPRASSLRPSKRPPPQPRLPEPEMQAAWVSLVEAGLAAGRLARLNGSRLASLSNREPLDSADAVSADLVSVRE
jgi:hypothetical protein